MMYLKPDPLHTCKLGKLFFLAFTHFNIFKYLAALLVIVSHEPEVAEYLKANWVNVCQKSIQTLPCGPNTRKSIQSRFPSVLR